MTLRLKDVPSNSRCAVLYVAREIVSRARIKRDEIVCETRFENEYK